MRIGVVSDTHNVLRPEVIASLRGCDYILHAGDLCCEELLMQLKALGKVCVVRGNNDLGTWAAELKVVERLKLDGLQIVMCQCLSLILKDFSFYAFPLWFQLK